MQRSRSLDKKGSASFFSSCYRIPTGKKVEVCFHRFGSSQFVWIFFSKSRDLLKFHEQRLDFSFERDRRGGPFMKPSVRRIAIGLAFIHNHMVSVPDRR